MAVTIISGLPYTITSPGDYRLDQDLVTTGHGIIVKSDNVNIDLNGHTISGPTAGDTAAYGISAFDYDNITIQNGSIDGFFYGVYLSDLVANVGHTDEFSTTSHLIQNTTITNSTFRGIRIEGNDNIVQNNAISDIGGTTLYENAYAFGIEAFGDARILNNTITEVRGRGEANIGEGVGISLSYHVIGAEISGNTISNASPDIDSNYGDWPAASRSTWGIWVGGDDTTGVSISNNIVENYSYGITFKRDSLGTLQDNTVTGAIAPFYLPSKSMDSGWDLGGNVGDIPDDTYLLRRNNPGNFEFVEQLYLAPLHRPDEDYLFRPLYHHDDGADTITGSATEYDQVDYYGATGAVFVDLENQTAIDGAGAVDTLASIEGAQGSAHDDLLIGDDNVNLLAGAEGKDTLIGNGGDDFLYGDDGSDMLAGGLGADLLDGGSGFNYARYDDADYGRVVASLGDASINTSAAAGDVYVDIQGLIMGEGYDTAYGDDGDNYLYGLGGDDTLFGGLGADNLIGGEGYDLAGYSEADYGDMVVSLANTALNTGAAVGDVYNTIEGLFMGSGDDLVYGDDGANLLYGNGGDDTIEAGGGNDWLFGGAGADQLDGGTGFDYVRFDDASYGAITASLADSTVNTGVALGDRFIDIEGLIMGSGNDEAIGDATDNYLYGQGGDDTLSGGAGADHLLGGEGFDLAGYNDADHGNLFVSLTNTAINTGAAFGDVYSSIEGLMLGSGNDRAYGDDADNLLMGMNGHDMLYGGFGADTLDGGSGYDYVRFDDADYGDVIASLADQSMNLGAAFGDQYIGIEGLVMGSGDDFAYGDAAANYLYGKDGDDLIAGGGGGDHIFGGAGFDGVAYDDMDYGNIVASLADSDMNSGVASGDVYDSIEGLVMGSGNDRAYGDAGDNVLIGGAGNDHLFGGDGADVLEGGDGLDYARYNDASYGNITASLADASKNTNVAAGDSYFGIEGLIMGYGKDSAYGDDGDNYLYGMQGSDMLYGGAGADRLVGGTGFDYARYNDANYGDIVVSLGDASLNTNVAAGDAFYGIEGLIMGYGNDVAHGDSGDNYVYGMQGDDTLYGGSGTDNLIGGRGNDSFLVDAGSGTTIVRDFAGGAGLEDVLLIDFGAAFDTVEEVTAVSSQQGSAVLIDFGAGDQLIIDNFDVGDFAADDFDFL